MKQEKIVVGSKWGKLTVQRKLERDKSGHRFVECMCECGNIAKVRASQLLCGDSKTCRHCPPSNLYRFDGDILFIGCKDGSEFFIDAADCDLVKQYQWYNGKGYAVTPLSSGKRQYLHRLIMDLSPSDTHHVDHVDGNKQNNRRSNLRLATSAQNNQNQNVAPRSSVGYRGVSVLTQNKNYRARIGYKGKGIHIGCFPTPVLAAQARNIASELLHGEYAGRLNEVPSPTENLYSFVLERCKKINMEEGGVVAS